VLVFGLPVGRLEPVAQEPLVLAHPLDHAVGVKRHQHLPLGGRPRRERQAPWGAPGWTFCVPLD
jgi:hypothetical protein